MLAPYIYLLRTCDMYYHIQRVVIDTFQYSRWFSHREVRNFFSYINGQGLINDLRNRNPL